MATTQPEHEHEEAPHNDDEDTGAQVAPIVKLEEVSVTTGEENEDAVLDLKVEGSLIAYAYRDLQSATKNDLQSATKNFSEKLGGGGFGSVFKGTLPNSTVIAVKKLESISQGEKQFRAEVSTIRTVQHINLVKLRGFCSEGDKKLLVYDYMPNGSLDCSDSRGRFGR